MNGKLAESMREIIASLSQECKILYVVPTYQKNNLGGDYVYLLHKEMIENNSTPQVIGLSGWSQFKYVFSAFRGKPVVLHYNWLEVRDRISLITTIYSWLCLLLFKRSGGKLIWTIHNRASDSYRYKWINKYVQKWMADKSDLIRVHCQTALEEMSDYLHIPGSKFVILPHPRFPAYLLPRTVSVEALNQRYGTKLQTRNQIFLMFGNIGPHKQMVEVAEMFRLLSANKKLLIVGPVKKGCIKYYWTLKKMASEDPHTIFIHPKMIEANIVPEFFNAADYCLFNYERILTSGGVELARSYQKPVIAPNMGCLKELKGNRDVYLFQSQSDLKKLLTDL